MPKLPLIALSAFVLAGVFNSAGKEASSTRCEGCGCHRQQQQQQQQLGQGSERLSAYTAFHRTFRLPSALPVIVGTNHTLTAIQQGLPPQPATNPHQMHPAGSMWDAANNVRRIFGRARAREIGVQTQGYGSAEDQGKARCSEDLAGKIRRLQAMAEGYLRTIESLRREVYETNEQWQDVHYAYLAAAM
ncbi:hypothetical protein GQ54DRAFT_308483 [Martensiomyces pterosporus]|nr:hypothetical protein GQ54DRAFT_308483 [Martensiomyces pterosporus]